MRQESNSGLGSKLFADCLPIKGCKRRASLAYRWGQTSLLALALMATSLPVKSAVSEFVVPSGPEITFQDGRTIKGHITRMDQRDLVISLSDGRTQTVPRSTVERVTFETVTGERLTGELVGWTPGVYQIATTEAALKIYSAAPPVQKDPTSIASNLIVPPANNDLDDDGARPKVALASKPLSAGRGNPQAIAALTTDGNLRSNDRPDTGALIEAPDAAVTPRANLRIHVSVEHSKENGPPVAFNIELSEPSEDPIVLIYATIDGTATRGEDYEPNRGVVMIQPGEHSARIEAPVIDDTEQEGREHLQLFLTVDPSVAVVEGGQIIANIDDDDQS